MVRAHRTLQSRLLILSSQALLITAVEALDAFPLFLLLLRVKSPHRLPGGSFLFLHLR